MPAATSEEAEAVVREDREVHDFTPKLTMWWARAALLVLGMVSSEVLLWQIVFLPSDWGNWAHLLMAVLLVVNFPPYVRPPGRALWRVTGEGFWSLSGRPRLLIAAEDIAGTWPSEEKSRGVAAGASHYFFVSGRDGAKGIALHYGDLAENERRELERCLSEVADLASREANHSSGPDAPRLFYRARVRHEPGFYRPALLVASWIGVQGLVLQSIESGVGWRAGLWLLPLVLLLIGRALWKRRRHTRPDPVVRVDEAGVWLLRGEPAPRLVLRADDVSQVLWGGPKMAIKRRDGSTLHLGVGRLARPDREDLERRIRGFAEGRAAAG